MGLLNYSSIGSYKYISLFIGNKSYYITIEKQPEQQLGAYFDIYNEHTYICYRLFILLFKYIIQIGVEIRRNNVIS